MSRNQFGRSVWALGVLVVLVSGSAMGSEDFASLAKGESAYVFRSNAPKDDGGSNATPSPSVVNSYPVGATTVGPATGTYPMALSVPAIPGTIVSVRATVTITHPNVADLQILAVSPTGVLVELLQNHNAAFYNTMAANNDTFIFDGRAAANGQGSFGGFMRPNQAGFTNGYPAPAPTGPYGQNMNLFNGESPSGAWLFYVHDKTPGSGDAGTVSIDKLEIETKSCTVQVGDNSIGNPYPVAIPVSGVSGTFRRARLKLNKLSHTWPDDLQIILVAPSGEKANVIYRCGGNADIINETIVVTDGGRPMAESTAFVDAYPSVFAPTAQGVPTNMSAPAPTGPYATSFAAAFAGATLNGTWNVYIADLETNDTGCIENIELELVTSAQASFEGFISLTNTDQTITAPGSTTGWSNFGLTAAENWVVTQSNAGYFQFPITTHPTKIRTSGLVRNKTGWLPLNAIDERFDVLSFFTVCRANQPNANDWNQIPNLRARVQQRFAANSMLEVFHHTGDTAAQTALEQELRPADYNPTGGSVYLVPATPIYTPRSTASGEGLQAAFEAFATLPQDQGALRLLAVGLSSLRKSAYPTETVPARTFAVSASDAGGLKVYNSAAELQNYTLNYGAAADDPPVLGAGTGGTYVETNLGITLSTVGQSTSPPLRVVSRNINPEDGGTAYVSRIRARENYLYTTRFQVSSGQISPFQSQLRFRARSIKFAWSQKLEIGGTYAAGSINNALARQLTPGFGTLNMDRNKPADSRIWYTMRMISPMVGFLRAEFPSGTPLTTRMPNITAQPGPGVSSASRRDIFVGLDILDTLSTVAGFENEASLVTLDRIELHEHLLPF